MVFRLVIYKEDPPGPCWSKPKRRGNSHSRRAFRGKCILFFIVQAIKPLIREPYGLTFLPPGARGRPGTT
jgi:hypothetical protein